MASTLRTLLKLTVLLAVCTAYMAAAADGDESPTPTASTSSPSPETPTPAAPTTPTTEPPTTAKPTSPTNNPTTQTSTASSAQTQTTNIPSGSTNSASSATTKASPTTDTPATSTSTITINFVNDLRYTLYPVSSKTEPCKPNDLGNDGCVGGLACLAEQVQAVPTGGVWLHSGLALGYGGDAYYDAFPLLRGQPVADALNKYLPFSAMSVDADMFRDGQQFAKGLTAGKFTCANCPSDLPIKKVMQYMTLPVAGAPCGVIVIGVINKTKADRHFTQPVKDELQGVKEAVEAIKKDSSASKNVLVVIGEVSRDTAETILKEVAEVSIVLLSGAGVNDTSKAAQVLDNDKTKMFASLPSAALGKDFLNVGRLQVALDNKCRPTDLSTAFSAVAYNKKQSSCSPTTSPDEVKQLVSDMVTSLSKAQTTVVGKSLLTLNGDVCSIVSCALGQLAADGVRTIINEKVADWTASRRSVFIPAGEFRAADLGGAAGSNIIEADVVGVLTNNPTLCWANLTGAMLYAAMEDAVKDRTTFPQLSGLAVDITIEGDSVSVHTVWAQATSLGMVPVHRDNTEAFSVVMPCGHLDRLTSVSRGPLDVLLKDGLLYHMRSSDSNLVPPQVEARVRQFIGIPKQSELCEDWVGMTVAYTLLVLGSMMMVGYQGYQFWRFRSTLSYIR